MILKDRVSDIYQNFSLCDNNCEYDEINIENMTVTCFCRVKTEIDTNIEPAVFETVVKDTFKDSSFGVIKCYKLVFSLNNKINNIGFWILSICFLLNKSFFISYFIFGIKSIKLFVYNEMEKNNYIYFIKEPTKKKLNTKKTINFPSRNNKINIYKDDKQIEIPSSLSKIKTKKSLNLNQNTINNYLINSNSFINNFKENNKSSLLNLKNNTINNIMIFNCKYNNNSKVANIYKTKRIRNIKKKHLTFKKENFSNPNNTINQKLNRLKMSHIYNNEDHKTFPGFYNLIQINPSNPINIKPLESKYILDNYDYENAIKYDKRTFWRIYYICLLSKENILNTFFFKSPLETQSLRLSLFLFNNITDLAFNSLFYFNQNISDKYHYKGDNLYLYIIINNMTISIFSALSSFILIKSLSLLISSKDDIVNLFRDVENNIRRNKNYKISNKTKKNIYKKLEKIYKCLKIKILFYIIFESFIILFFFYYILAFCEVYRETQINWIIDSIISTLLSILIELFTSFVISLLYILSIKFKLKPLYTIVLSIYGL